MAGREAKDPEKGVDSITNIPVVTIDTEDPLSPSPAPSADISVSNGDKPLDEEVGTVLGADPTAENKKLLELHQSLVARWPIWLSEGLPKESKDQVLEKYPRKGNINVETPELSEEVLATLNESGVKRDKLFTAEQNLVGSAMSAVGKSITMILKKVSQTQENYWLNYIFRYRLRENRLFHPFFLNK